MSRTTGGRAFAATSTRSSSASAAFSFAACSETTPIYLLPVFGHETYGADADVFVDSWIVDDFFSSL